MKRQSTVCDMCGAVKREANHWFSAGVATGINIGLHIYASNVLVSHCADLCGEECLHKWITVNVQKIKENNAKDQPAK